MARTPRRSARTPLTLALTALVVLAGNYWRQRSGETPSTMPPVAPAPGAPPRGGNVAAVGSFNIEWLGLDGKNARSDADLQHIARVIQSVGAPLLGLQEIQDEAVMERLVGLLPGYRYALGTSGRQQRCAILWDTARASVGRPVEWPDINRGLEKATGNLRAPLVANARVGDFDFLFVVVHLKAFFDEEAAGTRRTQAQRLRARLDEWTTGHSDKDVIVVGDFNDFAGSPALGAITKNSRFVNTGARLPKEAVTYLPRPGRIDHVMVSSPAVAQQEWTGNAFIYPKPRGAERKAYEKSVSDHLPTWATFDTSHDNDP